MFQKWKTMVRSGEYVVALYDKNSRLVAALPDWDLVETITDQTPDLKSVVLYDITYEQLQDIDQRTDTFEKWTESLSD